MGEKYEVSLTCRVTSALISLVQGKKGLHNGSLNKKNTGSANNCSNTSIKENNNY